MTSEYEKRCQIASRLAVLAWYQNLLEKYHKKLVYMGLIIKVAPEETDAFKNGYIYFQKSNSMVLRGAPKEPDAFDYNYQYDTDIETILK